MPDIVNVGYHSTNYYAISLNDGRLLVDCGWPGSMPQFTAAMKRKGVVPAEIKYILATHFHPDHAGLVDEFKQLGAQLILMESQTAALAQAAPPQLGKLPSFITISPSSNIPLTFAESRQFLASLGISGEIVPTPGHSDDSVTLILDDGSAFTGDLPPRFLVPDDDAVLQASWAALDQLNARHIYPAHGG